MRALVFPDHYSQTVFVVCDPEFMHLNQVQKKNGLDKNTQKAVKTAT